MTTPARVSAIMAEPVHTLSDLQSIISQVPDIPVRLDIRSFDHLLRDTSTLANAPTPSTSRQPNGAWYALALRAFELQAADLGDDLIAPLVLASHFEPHAYQLRVVREVLHAKRPAAILADEVGLGKTIEAGLILKELILRGVARSALIVAPKALLTQWQDALGDLFEERFVLAEERQFQGYEAESRVICSYGQLVSAFGRAAARSWDCLIVDEAHLLANPDSKRRRCVAEVRARWRLLLTATPIQNRVTDLYSLLDLAVPGRLGTMRQFIATYVADGATAREVVPAKADELRAIALETMCRTRRSETDVEFVPRRVDTVLVTPNPAEATANQEVTTYLRALYRRVIDVDPPQAAPKPSGRVSRADRASKAPSEDTNGGTFAGTRLNRGAIIREIVALQQSLSSSPQAIGVALRSRAGRYAAEREPLLALASRCDEVVGSKETFLLEALSALEDEPVLIFTLRLETARRLREVIAAQGRSVECYIGALDADERRALVARFNAGNLQTLVATDAGAEGLNLHERCHIVFNYDLHWNPMKMEQRIGRVHRLGQRHEVRVANFALRGSIDEYVLKLLQDKIRLFSSAIGEVDSVLADLQDGELDLEERLVDLWLRSDEGSDLDKAVQRLGESFEQARGQLTAAARRTVEVLG
jgi:SNF2 family DNA or RNA helicase